MTLTWTKCLSKIPGVQWEGADKTIFSAPLPGDIPSLKSFLDLVHVRFCLLKPFFEHRDYPLVEPRELMPSFEPDLYEYHELPGFSMVAFERPISYFQEIFQFDILHSRSHQPDFKTQEVCYLKDTIQQQNSQTFAARLPRKSQAEMKRKIGDKNITSLGSYPLTLEFLLQLDRAHVLSLNSKNKFYLSGIFASFPSELDLELKRFGLRIGKFSPGDNFIYEQNRNFVYQYLMELHGFPIVSERRTSASLFARKLFKMGETFLVRVLGQSDRTLTTLYSDKDNPFYPRVEKTALVSVASARPETLAKLEEQGLLVSKKRPCVILRTVYTQHKYSRNNVRQDRALSIIDQEIMHPVTGEKNKSFNILKDTYSMTLQLNDIVRGEFVGRTKFKRNEIVENTETHENRLKFLHTWLHKHQRRIIGYSEDFYSSMTQVLDHYMLNSDHYEEFNDLHDLYQEVWSQYSYIQQARKIQLLEDLQEHRYQGKKIAYLQVLEQGASILGELKFEVVNYFDPLVLKAIYIADKILSDSYLKEKYIVPPEDLLTTYGQNVRKLYGRMVALVDEFKAIRKTRMENSSRSQNQ